MNVASVNLKEKILKFSYNSNNIHIIDSYAIPKKEMIKWLELIRNYIKIHSNYSYSRTNNSWKREWCAHNLLFKFNYKISHTKEVDLNENEPIFRRVLYFILAIFWK